MERGWGPCRGREGLRCILRGSHKSVAIAIATIAAAVATGTTAGGERSQGGTRHRQRPPCLARDPAVTVPGGGTRSWNEARTARGS